jgi:hypothetical protein
MFCFQPHHCSITTPKLTLVHVLLAPPFAAPQGRSRMNSIGEVLGPLFFCGVELSNHLLLQVAAFSFLVFVIAEIVGALASNSLSLLGDAAAMSVDVFTVRNNAFHGILFLFAVC